MKQQCTIQIRRIYVKETNQNVIGIAKDFYCRWSYQKGKFTEEKSDTHGVAGLFIFPDNFILLFL